MRSRSVNARARKSHPRERVFIQPLEERKLLATLNVVNFGAIPNDSGDDRNAIVAAINASNNGDTIFFPAGVYRLSKEIGTNNGDVHKPLGRGRIYKGETTFTTTKYGVDFNGNVKAGAPVGEQFVINDRTVLLSTGTDPDQPQKKNSLFNFRETNPNPGTFNAKFTNLTLRGRPFNMATNVGAMVEGVIIDNCHLDVTGGGQNVGVEFTTGLRNTQITNNIFHLGGSNGIYGYNWDNLNISNNWFLNPPGQPGSEGVHIIAHLYSSPNLLMEQNYFTGIRRMAIETQGGGVNTIIQDNWYEDPYLVGSPIPPGQPGNPTNDSFAYSIINDRADGVKIYRNVAIMPTKAASPQNGYVRIVFEIGGKNVDMQNNYSDGGNHIIAGNGTGATGKAYGNYIINFAQNPGNANGSQIRFTENANGTGEGNGPGRIVNGNYVPNGGYPVTLGDIGFNPFATDRLRPEPNKQYGVPTPPPTGVPAPTGLVANTVSSSQINLNWSDQATDETAYRVDVFLGGVLQTQNFLAADATSYAVTGLLASTQYSFKVYAIRNAEVSAASNEVFKSTASNLKPATPTNLVGTTVGLTTINLTWQDNATNETGYRVERLSEDGVTWVVLTPELLPADATSYQVTSIISGRTFQFRVFAVNETESVESDPSNIAVVQTPLPDVGSTGTSLRRTRPAVYFAGTSSTAVGPNVTGGT